MRIVLVNRFFYPDLSATSQMLTDLAFHLAGRRHQVSVVTSRLRYDQPGVRLPPSETVAGVRIERVDSTEWGRKGIAGRLLDYISFTRAARRRLGELMQPGDLLIAKTDPPMIAVTAARIARKRGAKLVVWHQDLFPEVAIQLGLPGLSGRLGHKLIGMRNRALAGAAANVAIGAAMAELLESQKPRPANVRIIENWSDVAAIRPIDRADNPLAQRLPPGEPFVVGYSGNLGRAHDVDTLLGAVRALRDDSRVLFRMTGGGAGMRTLREIAAREQLTNLSFAPYVPRDQLSQGLGLADLHLAGLRPELEGLILPSKVYGIAAAGRPMAYIGDPEAEVPRLFAEHGAGVGIRQGDSEALIQLIGDLHAHPERCRQMGRNARALAEKRFDRRRAMATWERLLDDC